MRTLPISFATPPALEYKVQQWACGRWNHKPATISPQPLAVKELHAILVPGSRPMGINMFYSHPYQYQSMHWNSPSLEKYLAWGSNQLPAWVWHRMSLSQWDHSPVRANTETNKMIPREWPILSLIKGSLTGVTLTTISQLLEHSYSNSLGMVTIRATRPVVGVAAYHELTFRVCCGMKCLTVSGVQILLLTSSKRVTTAGGCPWTVGHAS